MARMLPLMRLLITPDISSLGESRVNLTILSVGNEVKGASGVNFEGGHEIKSSVDSYNVARKEDLWAWTLKHVAKDEEELRVFKADY